MSEYLDVLVGVETELSRQTAKVHEAAAGGQAISDSLIRKEEFQLVERVFLLPGREAPHVVVFCGVDENAGAERVCARAGEILACHTNTEVCLVDGNLQSPRLQECFAAADFTGVADSSIEAGRVRNCTQLRGGGRLSLLPAEFSSGDARVPWDSERIRLRLAEFRDKFSYVLVNAPPVNRHVGATLFGRVSEGVILVIESNVTPRESTRRAKDELEAAGVKLLGGVLNNRSYPIPESVYRKLVTGFSAG